MNTTIISTEIHPKSAKELCTYFKLRIRMNHSKHNQLLAFLNKYSYKKQWVVAYEMQQSTNPHIHACFRTCDLMVKRQSLVKYIKRHWEGAGNRLYSLVSMSLDDDEDEAFGWPIRYLCYLSKQENVYWNVFTESEKKYIANEEKKIKEELAAAKLLRKTQIEQIYAYLQDKTGDIITDNRYTSPYYKQELPGQPQINFYTIETIVKHTLAWYEQRGIERITVMRSGYIYNICYTLCIKLVPHFAVNVSKQLIFKLKDTQEYDLPMGSY